MFFWDQLIFLYLLVNITAYLHLGNGNPCRTLHFVSLARGKRLGNHVIQRKQVSSEDWCKSFCLWDNNCVSINFRETKDSDSKHLCELNDAEGSQHPDDLQNEAYFNYHGATSSCNNKSCKGNGFDPEGCRTNCPTGCPGNDCSNQVCRNASWRDVLDSGNVWATCYSKEEYLRGFWRSTDKPQGNYHDERMGVLQYAKCCSALNAYSNKKTKCTNTNWRKLLNGNKVWAKCPNGKFLQGVYKSSGIRLHKIERGKCCRPKGYSGRWGHCYDHDVSDSFNRKGWSLCNDEYYLVGIYKGGCDWLHCINKFKCCKMLEPF